MSAGEGQATGVLFDRSDPAFLDDPYPVWATLRDEAPLYRTDSGTYLVTRYGDVSRMLRDRGSGRDIPERLVRRAAGTGATGTSFLASVLNMEGTEHTRLRRAMLHPFTARLVARQRERVRAVVEELLARTGDEEFDLVEAVAADLPVLLLLDTLGLPAADCDVVKRNISGLIDASELFPGEDALRRSDEANAFFARYFDDALGSAREGLLADLASSARTGGLTAVELAANATLLLFAGHETTTNSIANSVLALLRRPELLERLRADRGLLATAVDELLRYDSPVQTTIRWTRVALDLPSGRIEPRRFVEVSLAAANRDPRAFDRPDDIVLDRADNAHVAFGAGVHLCLGAALARLANHTVLQCLLDRYAVIEPAGEPARMPSLWNRGLERLPLRVRRP
jgi:unspecific monooxygenase